MHKIEKLIVILLLPFLLLHILVRFMGMAKDLCKQDQSFNLEMRSNPFKNSILQFAYYIVFLPEYRSVFYYRTGWIGRIMKLYLHGQKCLYISTPKVGGGICVNHGHSTQINAKSIGENCIVFQNVTIGKNGKGPGPVIGNNCYFGTGCVVLGNIRIGNNVLVGANAIVVKDIPDNCTVVTKGTWIVKKDGEKVNIPL